MSSLRMVTLVSPRDYGCIVKCSAMTHHSRQRRMMRLSSWRFDEVDPRKSLAHPCPDGILRKRVPKRPTVETCRNSVCRIHHCLRCQGAAVALKKKLDSREGSSRHSPLGRGRDSTNCTVGCRGRLENGSEAYSSGTAAVLSSMIGLALLCTPAAEASVLTERTGFTGISEEYQVAATISVQENFESVLEKQTSLELQTELALHNVLAPTLGGDKGDMASCQASGNSSAVYLAANGLDSASATVAAMGPVAAAASTAAATTTAVAALSVPAVAARVVVGTSGAAAAAASSAISTLQPPVASLGVAGPGVLGPVGTALANAVQHFGGGSIAGAVGATVVFPLDTVKTKMQAQKETEGEEPEYKDPFDCFCQLIAKEGPGSLYSGLVPQLIGIAPEKALKLTVNEMLLSVLQAQMPGSSIWALELLAGAGGGGSQVVFTNPVEIVKVRLQTQNDSGMKPKTAMEVVRELGLSGLYNGTLVTLARDVPSSSLFFGSYAFLKPMFPGNAFFAGALAAAPATLLVTPMDVIKTRMQMELRPGEEPYKDAWDCMWRIIKQEGFSALFKGGMTRVLRVSPQFGITLMVYDLLC